MATKVRKKTALVLSVGGLKGYAHLGVIRRIQELGIKIDFTVGASVGAIFASSFALGIGAEKIEEMALELTQKDLQDVDIKGILAGVYHGRFPQGLLKGTGLKRFIVSHIGNKNFEDCVIPVYIVAAHIGEGAVGQVVLSEGPLAEAIRASCAIPGIYAPVRFKGMTLVDGGIVNGCPVDVAYNFGAREIYAVNVTGHSLEGLKLDAVDNLFEGLMHSLTLAAFESSKYKVKEIVEKPDVKLTVIEPVVPQVVAEVDKLKLCIEKGYEAACHVLPSPAPV